MLQMHKIAYVVNDKEKARAIESSRQKLMKWVQWEKGLYVMTSVRWLKKKHKENPNLFPHWAMVHP
jgi:hypothetical protein